MNMNDMEFKNLCFEVSENIAILTLNRPESLNALDNETLAELATLFLALQGRDDIRVLMVTGEGRAFCAGGDVKGQPTRFGWAREMVMIGMFTMPEFCPGSVSGSSFFRGISTVSPGTI